MRLGFVHFRACTINQDTLRAPVWLLHPPASPRTTGSPGLYDKERVWVCLTGTRRLNKLRIYLSWPSLAASQLQCGRWDNFWSLSKNTLSSWKTFRLRETWGAEFRHVAQRQVDKGTGFGGREAVKFQFCMKEEGELLPWFLICSIQVWPRWHLSTLAGGSPFWFLCHIHT